MNTNFFYNLAKNKLFNLCRSLTGEGTSKTLKILKQQHKKLKIISIKSGTKVFDWKIPHEWNIKKAIVLDKFKNKIIDFKENNLKIIGYSEPKNLFLDKNTFFKNVYSLPKQPNAIPYITSYYKKRWGFCLSQKELNYFKKKYKTNDKFKVLIKSSFKKNGNLKYGEYVIRGKSSQEILISTYICHPSMANDNLSGIIVSMALISYFKKIKNLKKTLKFIFIPETIGSIAYIKKNFDNLKKNVIAGYTLSCVGDELNYSIIFSKYKNSISDKALMQVYKSMKIKPKKYSFLNRGSDERQFNSPLIDLKLTGICRSKYGKYKEYHTSLDDFNLVTLKGVRDSYKIIKKTIVQINNKIIPISKVICEPNLGKRNLYPTFSIKNAKYFNSRKFTNFLQYSDGTNDLNEISKIIKLNIQETKKIYKILLKNNLISS